jgi:hypothetical protein
MIYYSDRAREITGRRMTPPPASSNTRDREPLQERRIVLTSSNLVDVSEVVVYR